MILNPNANTFVPSWASKPAPQAQATTSDSTASASFSQQAQPEHQSTAQSVSNDWEEEDDDNSTPSTFIPPPRKEEEPPKPTESVFKVEDDDLEDLPDGILHLILMGE